ncbi:MAG TPA: proteasome assembly chaperone family protein [archaeon]|nr:proteasome assembly chaperone family protein [archaeon]
MTKTAVHEKSGVKLKNPILIEGLPGLGSVGKIAVTYLTKQLNANVFARMYSQHFPYHVIVNKKGSVRMLRYNFYYWKNTDENADLIFLTGDSQAQTIEGQYEIANEILKFATVHGVKSIIALGGFGTPITETEPQVIGVATSAELLKKLKDAGVKLSQEDVPIVGTAGLLVGLSKFRHTKAACLLGETMGYMPDPKAAKSVLKALTSILDIEIDFSDLDKEIEKTSKLLNKMKEVEEKIEIYEKTLRKVEKEKTSYIS